MKIRTHKDLEVYRLAFTIETQSWLDFSLSCSYMTSEDHLELYRTHNQIIGKLVNMSLHPDNWSW